MLQHTRCPTIGGWCVFQQVCSTLASYLGFRTRNLKWRIRFLFLSFLFTHEVHACSAAGSPPLLVLVAGLALVTVGFGVAESVSFALT